MLLKGFRLVTEWEKLDPSRFAGIVRNPMATQAFDSHELSRFLARRWATDPKTATMTGMGEKKGKWFIQDADYSQFLDLMYDYLFVKKGRTMAFVEQPKKGEPKPLLIDLDFKYPPESSLVRTFTLEQIRSFCQMLVNGLQIFFGVTDIEYLRFFVTLRPAPYSSGQTRKDGVHILCPDIALSDEKQKVLRNWMLSEDAVGSCFSGTGFMNKPEDIYDESMVRKQGWIFYGESKPNIPPYTLQGVFKYTPSEDAWTDDEEQYTPRQLLELLSVRYQIVEDQSRVLDASEELYEAMKVWGENLPIVAPTDLSGNTEIVTTNNALIDALHALYPVDLSQEERQMIRRFVMECLSDERASKYETWIRVGWCLHNIDPSEDYFQLWMDFSAKSGKAAGNNVAQLRRDWFNGWRKHDDGPRLTERSLRMWAKTDNPVKYSEIQDEYLGEYIRQEIEPTHHHIALLMKKKYGANYVASVSAKFTDWFEYNDKNNMWRRLNQGIELRSLICSDIAEKIAETSTSIYSKIGLASSQDMKEALIAKQKKLMKVQMSLFSSGFCDSVMKMAVHQFYEADFQHKLNINGNLFACRNGMIELRVPGADGRDHVVFRDGRPEDYMSFLAGQNAPEMEAIDYKPYDPADPAQIEIMEFFAKLFPYPEVRRYTLRLLASCLEGYNREQCFYIATGVGGNGKSKLVELMRMTLGDYQTALQSTVLTRHRPESGAANPDIMAAKCRRFIYLQEPDDKEPLNTSRMKQFSGEDMVEARALYGDQEKFVIMGKLFMMCNKLPPVTTMDRGTWRRIRVIEFVSKFVLPDHPEYLAGRPNVFLMDPMMDKKLRSWREPFLALLVHIYENEYIPFGLNPVPAAVMKASDKYKENFDIYARFRAERVREPKTLEEKMSCMAEPVTTNKIKTIVAAWKKDARVELNTQDVVNRMTEEFGEPLNGKEWQTIRVFASDEMVADWDAAQAVNTS
jgi:phage/plasmid-associated DNA primase